MMRPYPQEGMYPPMPQQMGPMGPMGPMMGPMGPMGQMPPYMPPHPMPASERPMTAPQLDLPNDKEQLGERLYPMVEMKNPTNASKITGMLLEMEVEQIQNIIRDPSQLDRWIAEAMKVYFTLYSYLGVECYSSTALMISSYINHYLSLFYRN